MTFTDKPDGLLRSVRMSVMWSEEDQAYVADVKARYGGQTLPLVGNVTKFTAYLKTHGDSPAEAISEMMNVLSDIEADVESDMKSRPPDQEADANPVE